MRIAAVPRKTEQPPFPREYWIEDHGIDYLVRVRHDFAKGVERQIWSVSIAPDDDSPIDPAAVRRIAMRLLPFVTLLRFQAAPGTSLPFKGAMLMEDPGAFDSINFEVQL